MLRMLVLSDKLTQIKAPTRILDGAIELYPWSESDEFPRPSDYEIVVLDMSITNSNSLPWDTFLNLRNDIANLFQAGGIVICLNYFTQHGGQLIQYNPAKSKLKYKDIQVVRNGTRYEMSYDWLMSEELLSKLNIAETDAKAGANFILITKKKAYIDYFTEVKEYHKIIENIEQNYESSGNQLKLNDNVSLDIEVLALTKVTKKPIACVVKLLNGSLILLPQSNGNSKTIVSQLYEIGSLEYETRVGSTVEVSAPQWLANYKHNQEVEIDNSIEKHNVQIKALKKERQRFAKIDFLLYGSGDQLEDAVELALKELGCVVEKTEKGASVDFKVIFGNKKFVFEVTGIDDKVFKDNKHFGHILHYLPEREDNEKIVFLANTYRNMDIKDRMSKEQFTQPVIDMSRNNHIVLKTTADLFRAWADFLDGKPIDSTFDKIYRCDGEFKY